MAPGKRCIKAVKNSSCRSTINQIASLNADLNCTEFGSTSHLTTVSTCKKKRGEAKKDLDSETWDCQFQDSSTIISLL